MDTMSWLLAAVTLATQDPGAATARGVTHAERALRGPDGRLQLTAAALAHVQLADLANLDALGAQAADLAQLGELAALGSLSTLGELSTFSELSTLRELASLEHLAGDPPLAWADQDPGDARYKEARKLLNRGRYADAARAFADLTKRYPRSAYTPDAYYWQAFALYKTGDAANYRAARTVLKSQERRYPSAATLGDAQTLFARIQGELARQGDPDAAEWVRVHAQSAAQPPQPPRPPRPPTPPTPPTPAGAQGGCPADDDDDDPRIAALNALLQMDADAAVPILKQVLARRDRCSVTLRRKAVFIISQKRTAETEEILLTTARTDPDAEVRGQAVFWLSQVGSERAVSALDSILQTATDPELQKKAIFALSQIRAGRAGQILRDFAERSSASSEAREQAIFWLGQQRSPENAAFLRGLYARVNNDDLKEKVIFSLSQMRTDENGHWLLDLALNEREPIEMRKKALFWAGQMGVALGDLTALYNRTSNDELKEQLIFVYSQRREREAVEKLIDIAQRDPNRELRKKAVFWLGQSRDPRARQALLDIINQ